MGTLLQNNWLWRITSAAIIALVSFLGLWLLMNPQHVLNIFDRIAEQQKDRGAGPVRLATASPGGAYFTQGMILRDQLAARTGYDLELIETAGSMENMRLVQSGACDFGLIQGGLDSDFEGLTALTNLAPQYLHIIVPVNSTVQHFSDLAGKRVGVGPADSGSEALASTIFDYFDFAEPASLVNHDSDTIEDAFSRGDIDAAIAVYSLFTPNMESLFSTGYFRLVSVPEAAAIARYLPGVQATSLPYGIYGPGRRIPAQDSAPVMTLTVNTILIASANLAPQLVRTMLNQIYTVEFRRNARLVELNETDGMNVAELPLHPAAQRFFNRNAPISSDRFEIASFLLAGCICVVSLFKYLQTLHHNAVQTRRRETIRPYFKAMLDFGIQIQSATTRSELVDLIQKMMSTQRQAEQKWLKGLLDTEDMENLYAVYGLRSTNAYNKIMENNFYALRTGGAMERDDVPQPGTFTPTPQDEDAFFRGAGMVESTASYREPRRPLSEEEISSLVAADDSGAGEVRVRKKAPAHLIERQGIPAEVDDDVPDERAPDQMELF